MRNTNRIILSGIVVLMLSAVAGAGEDSSNGWKTLPLITEGKIDPAWRQIGFGGFAVEDGTLKTEPVEQGLGLLVYTKEKFGNCQIRVVYKQKDAKSNSGVIVRLDEGILTKADEKHAGGVRNKDGSLTDESMKVFMDASEKEIGPWYAVHHGYEVQIRDDEDAMHRTGAIYSLAEAKSKVDKAPGEWKTMIITLKGNLVLIDIDGEQVTTFDPDSPDVPRDRQWFEPKRETMRPQVGYIALQNHDPGDVAYFKEVSVRPLAGAK